MRDFSQAFVSIPPGHLGLVIAMAAVLGAFAIGIIAVVRAFSVYAQLAKLRTQFVIDLAGKGWSSDEILAILDHPAMSSTRQIRTPTQREQDAFGVSTASLEKMKRSVTKACG